MSPQTKASHGQTHGTAVASHRGRPDRPGDGRAKAARGDHVRNAQAGPAAGRARALRDDGRQPSLDPRSAARPRGRRARQYRPASRPRGLDDQPGGGPAALHGTRGPRRLRRPRMRQASRSRSGAPDRGRPDAAEGRRRQAGSGRVPRSQDRLLRRADRRLPQCLHRTHAQAAPRPDPAVADHVDVATETDQQEPARGDRDLACHPERRCGPRRTLLRRSHQRGRGGRART
ncbi:hypothetical protein ACVW1A_005010 [Bradyrhizobium sp. LB1.3]